MSKQAHRVIQLSSYTSPQVTEVPKKGWVQYGQGDSFYTHLIDLYHSSPTNNAAIQGISDLIFGNGLYVNMLKTDVESYAWFVSTFLDEDVRRVCHDLKLFGHAAFQVLYEDGELKQVCHIERNSLRPCVMNEDGEIEGYYFSNDWSKADKRGYKPQYFPAYGFQSEADPVAIMCVDQYSAGSTYFTPVDYQGGLQYAELESEIANYHVNNVRNGLAPSMILNFNNGIPDDEKQMEMERDIKRKWGGSNNAGKFILAFNDGPDNKATIESVPLSDAHNQYQFLSTECMTKIMVAHRITSPMLLGIKDNSGFGNNAQEMATAYELFKNTVIQPFRNQVLEVIQAICYDQDKNVDVSFEDLVPINTEATAEAATAQLKSDVKVINPTEADVNDWLEDLSAVGETIDTDEWELIYEAPVDDPEESDDQFYKLFKRFADPKAKSKDDTGMYRVRYRYDPMEETKNDKGEVVSRTFCRAMVANAKSGVLYRRDDIDKMSKAGINGEWAKRGASKYDIWRFKGGGGCYHRWWRMVFKRKQVGGKVLPLDDSEKGTTERNLDRNYNEVDGDVAKSAGVPTKSLEPKGYDKAITKPKDMKKRGFINRY